MAHYCYIDSENIITETFVGKDETNTEDLPEGYSSWENYYETKRDGLTCIRWSYNTDGNAYYITDENGNRVLGPDQTKAFRGNGAGIGGSYDPINDVILHPKPDITGLEFILNTDNWTWEATE